MKSLLNFGAAAIIAIGLPLQLRAQQQDQVAGNMILLMENGGWCWYQDERVLVDTDAGTILFHAIQNYLGVGGTSVDADVLIGSLDLASRNRPLHLLANVSSYNSGDDHNVGGLWIRPDGRYFAAYAGHNDENDETRMRISNQPNDMTSWQNEFQFNWTNAGGQDGNVTYSNIHFLADEGNGSGRLYNITRQWQRSPIVGYSDDWGETWNYGGAISLPVSGRGYSNGYYKYTNNGIDRIDFIMTEAHPRDFNTNIFHGYIRGGQSFNTQGNVIDSDVFDQNAPDPQAFTAVFTSSPEDNNNDASEYHRAWTVDLERVGGSLYALFTTRYGTQVSADRSGDADHRIFYAKLENSQGNWTYTELAKMGIPLDPREQDYTGLGAIDPNDPNVVYISTPINPSTDVTTTHWEIYRGESQNDGATWNWTAITSNSTADNFRPIVPSWDASNTAVLWLRGEYVWQHEHDQTVVGLVQPAGETVAPMTYVDATTSNTTLSSGGALNATGPGSGQGSNDQQWHWRTGYGNDGSVLTSAETGGENAPALRTQFSIAQAGTYDIWANFWANPSADWRIRAGLSTNNLSLYRRKASQQVAGSAHAIPITLTGTGNVFLYQAYLGRVQVSTNGTVDVYVDDYAIQVGTANTSIGDVARSWYDGVSYALVGSPVGLTPSEKSFFSLNIKDSDFGGPTAINFSVKSAGPVELKVYDTLGKESKTLVNRDMTPGEHRVEWSPKNLTPGLYFIQIKADGNSQVAKWVLK